MITFVFKSVFNDLATNCYMQKISHYSYPIIFLLLLPLVINATVPTDTLSINKNQKDKSYNKAVALYTKADKLKISDPQKALLYNREALSYAHDVNSVEILAKINQLMGDLYATENNLQPAINYYLISEKLFKEQGDKKEIAMIFSKLGRMYYTNNFELDKALSYYNKMMDIALELNDEKLLATSYHNLGGLFLSFKDNDKANNYYNKLLTISEKLNDKAGIASALNNIGEIERIKGNYKKALDYYKQSLVMHEQLHDLRRIAINLENIGSTYDAMGNPSEALKYYKQSLLHYRVANDQKNIASVLVLMGKNAVVLDSLDEAQNNYQEAFTISKKNLINKYKLEALKGISTVYEKKGNLKTALYYYKKYESCKDSISKENEKNNIAVIKTQLLSELDNIQYKLQKYDIEMLTKDKKINRLKMNILIASLIIFILLAILFIIRYNIVVKKQRQIREKDAELHKAQQDLMASEIKTRDDDLMSFALHIVQKNKLLKELRYDLKELSTTADEDTSKKLKELSFNVKQMLQIQDDIDLFEQKVNQTYDGFFSKLKQRFPNLTRNEERLCAMLKLKLSSKEIASINNTSIKAVEMSRYRLRKKCGIANKTGLTDYIGDL
jgi:tetratricopeptide (TPR) repeat protein